MRAHALVGGISGAVVMAALLAGAGRAEAPPAGAADALRSGKPGLAVINCKVAGDRSLTDCKLIRESPPGSGFGAAALKMSRLMRLSPGSTADAGGRITLPILFRPSSGEDSAPTPPDLAPAVPPPPPDPSGAYVA
jgi:TonB family protein